MNMFLLGAMTTLVAIMTGEPFKALLFLLVIMLVVITAMIFQYFHDTRYGPLPTPTKCPPMPKCKPPRVEEECALCGRPMSRYWKELED